RELACLFPEMLESLAAADRAVAEQLKDESDARRLSDRIYPPTNFEPDARQREEADLRETKNAQPALGAVSFGVWRVLSERFGVTADAFAGHSYGELVALAAARRFGSAELFRLSRLRGRLMGEQRTGDPGGMLAVLAPLPDIERVLSEHKLDLVVANKNAPKQTVLSGATSEIERAAKLLADAGLNSARLPVAAAFHSRLVADAATPFLAALQGVEFQPAAVPVFANTTAASYPDDPNAARSLLAHQLAKPVEFVELIRAMTSGGVKTFVEVGPGSVLTRLVSSILADSGMQEVEVFAIDASGGKRSGVLELADTLARIAARGHSTKLAAWEEDSRCRPATPTRKRGTTLPLSGANYVQHRPKRSPTLHNGAVKVTGMPDPDPNALSQALLMTQQSLAALQRMQEQTAALHKQFLDSQEAAQRTLQSLVEQQQSLLLSGLGAGAALSVSQAVPRAPAATVVPMSAPPAAPPASRVAIPALQPAPAPASKATSPNTVGTTLLAVVSEKTGYPVESLDLSLSLDADLGVDSIKRVEILATLQERLPDAPQIKPEHLGSLHSLKDVAEYLVGRNVIEEPATAKIPITPPPASARSPGTIAPPAPRRSSVPTPPDTEHVPVVRPASEAIAELKNDRPRKSDPVRQPMDRSTADPNLRGGAIGTDRVDRSILQAVDLDLGTIRPRVPLLRGGEFWVVADREPVAEAVVELLGGHGFKPKLFAWAAAMPEKPASPLTGLLLISPKGPGADSGLNRRAFEWLKHAGAFLRQTARTGGVTFATVARLDGAFGLAEIATDANPIAGGLAGLAKTVRHEWPEVYCKAIDLAPGFEAVHADAAAAVDEILTAGPIEVGIAPTHRCTLELARTVRRPSSQLINLGPKDVILVTGGARGVTAEVAVALAETYSPTLVLTGRTPMPAAEP
ncbi:MAG TPA: acyltransferase domain-containing protein, partial [Gemmata sp.]|nr:acyltransferase domain-containing protein [Gemmata sp.]